MKIADRSLRIRRGSVPDVSVQIRIFAPRPIGRAWSCAYEIDWPGAPRKRDISGLDSMQALFLALQAIGTDLYTSEHHRAGELVWEQEGRGYGFPVPKTIRDLLIGDDAAPSDGEV
jgi:hypothetical protein